MVEFIASVIGLIGALIAVVQFIFKPIIKKCNEFKNICSVVEESFKRWKELEYSVRGGTMISHDYFILVNKYQSKFNKKDKELKSFLLRNAIQNGLGGNWGSWLYLNKDNETIILPLILTLNCSAGLRPVWRSAIILEKIFSKNSSLFDAFIPEKEKNNLSLETIVTVIKNRGVTDLVYDISKNGSKVNREKAQMVIEEFEVFSKELTAFAKEQTIIMEL